MAIVVVVELGDEVGVEATVVEEVGEVEEEVAGSVEEGGEEEVEDGEVEEVASSNTGALATVAALAASFPIQTTPPASRRMISRTILRRSRPVPTWAGSTTCLMCRMVGPAS